MIPDFTPGFAGSHDGRKITLRTEIVAVDYGGILRVGGVWRHELPEDLEIRRVLQKFLKHSGQGCRPLMVLSVICFLGSG